MAIIKGNYIAATHPPRAGHLPPLPAQRFSQPGGGVTHSENQHMARHGRWFAI